MTRENGNEDAVSETVGYILLFAIVTLSMGIIYAIGYPVLQSNIDANIFESAEQSFIVLQSNMNRVAFDQTPVKILKINLMSSSITISDQSSITIDDNINPPLNVSVGEIIFEKDDKTIAYEMGAVFKTYSGGKTIMVSDPSIFTDTIDGKNVTTIGIIAIRGNESVAGKGITSLILKHNSSDVEKGSVLTDVDIHINSIHASGWKNYLEENGFTIISATQSTVDARRSNTTLILSRHVTDVKIQ